MLPGPVRGAGDVQRVLGLDKQLSWQIFRVGSVSDPVEAGADVPRTAAIVRAMKAAASKGVSKGVIDAVFRACEEYEDLVGRHADNRGSFDAMVRGLRTDEAQIHLKDRRTTYRGNIALWGIQVQTHYNLAIYHPNEEGTHEDNIRVFGCVGLRKLRAGAGGHVLGQTVAWATTTSGQGEATPMERRTIDLLDEYSTNPFPPIRTREAEQGRIEMMFESETLGKAGELTYFVRDLSRGIGELPQPWWGNMSMSRMPTEVAILDMLVPEGWSDPSTAYVRTYGNLRNFARVRERFDEDQLPVSEEILHLGRNLDLLRTPRVPRCPEMIEHVLGDAGWSGTRFDIYRCVVQYPILCAGVGTRVDAAQDAT